MVLGYTGPAEQDIVTDSIRKDKDLLGDKADVFPQRLQGDLPDIPPINENGPGLRIQKASYGIKQSSLPGTNPPDNSYCIPGLNF